MSKKNNHPPIRKQKILSENFPLISIIVRTKNRNTLLQNALNSLVSQNYANLEVILINDGGHDISKLIHSYEKKLDIITIFNKQSVGRAKALNDGLSAANGEWIGILDDDDIYLPGALLSLIKFSENTAAKAVYGKVEMLDFQDIKKPKHLRFFDMNYNKDRFIFDNYIPVNSLLFKREIIKDIGNVDSNFEIFEDWDFFYRIAQVTNFHFLDYLVAEYRSYGDATAIGGKSQELHSKYRTLFYQKHFKSFTPSMLTNFYNLVLQDNQKKYLSTIDQLLKLNHTFNERNDHSLVYTKQVNDAIFLRFDHLVELNQEFNKRNDHSLTYTKQVNDAMFVRFDQLVELNQEFNKRNDHSLTYTKQVNDAMFARFDQLERQVNGSEASIIQKFTAQQAQLHHELSSKINAIYEQNNQMNELRQQQISTILDQNNQVNEHRQQQFEYLNTQLTDIKLQISQQFSSRLARFIKRIFTH